MGLPKVILENHKGDEITGHDGITVHNLEVFQWHTAQITIQELLELFIFS
jgi:hypothetical protein